MAIEAPLSRYKRGNFKIYIVVWLVLAAWFAYDGYLNKSFIDEHTDEQGHADGVLAFNRTSPPIFAGLAGVIAAYFYVVRGRKVVAEEKELVIAGRKRIPYDAIEAIDKTHFEQKGFFLIIYKDSSGAEVRYKLSDRQYDNLGPVLDHLVAQIT
jgi:hypothetical protein